MGLGAQGGEEGWVGGWALRGAGVDLVDLRGVWGRGGGCGVAAAASLPLQVAQLHVVLAPLLLGEQGAEGVELGFGWVALARDVHLVVAAVDEVRRDGRGQAVRARRRRHEAQAHVALQGVAVGAAGGGAGQLPVAVDGLAPPRPQVQLGVVVLQHQHDEAAGHAVMALLQQSLPAQEVCVLVETRRKRLPTSPMEVNVQTVSPLSLQSTRSVFFLNSLRV